MVEEITKEKKIANLESRKLAMQRGIEEIQAEIDFFNTLEIKRL